MTGAIPFFKMSGSGNDFILIDNRNGRVSGADAELAPWIRKVCARRLGVGADGLVLVEKPAGDADFRWRFFNADGSVAEMCGNASRCVARFALIHGIAGERSRFETLAGVIHAQVLGERAKVRMTEPSLPDMGREIATSRGTVTLDAVNTGVPHAVMAVEDIDAVDVAGLGREIRFHAAFAPAGTNVNFVAPGPGGAVFCRTYERGVEDETLACGTGCVAVALVRAKRYGTDSPVTVITRSGGRLVIHFRRAGEGFTDVYLEGDARIVYRAEMNAEAWNWAM